MGLLLGAAEQDYRVALNAQDELGLSALHYACKSGHAELATSLLKAGARHSLKDVDGKLPLHMAAEQGHLSCADVLLHAGANIEASCKRGRTCLHYARTSNHAALALWL